MAFAELVRRWEGPVGRILLRLTDARPERLNGDIEDLSQEVFLRVLTASRRYTEQASFATWLYAIALNVSRDAARRRRKWWKLERQPRPTADIEQPLQHTSRQELEQAIRTALAALPAKLREPLVLRHFGELTFEETARLLGQPVTTIKSRVQAALVQLRTELRQRGIDPQD